MRHRSRTGSRAGKMKHAKGRFCVGLWRVFLFVRGWKCSEGTRSLHPLDAVLRRVWESSQQAFLHGAGRTRSKNGRLVPVCTACTLHVAKRTPKFRMLMLESPAAAAAQFGSNSPAVPAVPGCSDAVQSRNFANSLNHCGWYPSSSLWPWR